MDHSIAHKVLPILCWRPWDSAPLFLFRQMSVFSKQNMLSHVATIHPSTWMAPFLSLLYPSCELYSFTKLQIRYHVLAEFRMPFLDHHKILNITPWGHFHPVLSFLFMFLHCSVFFKGRHLSYLSLYSFHLVRHTEDKFKKKRKSLLNDRMNKSMPGVSFI